MSSQLSRGEVLYSSTRLYYIYNTVYNIYCIGLLRVVAHETVRIGCEKIPQDFSFVLPSQNGKTQIFLYERSV